MKNIGKQDEGEEENKDYIEKGNLMNFEKNK